jgi:hypothetical protein
MAFVARSRVDPLERERQEIEKRRARFEDRRKRILDAKTRTMGVDLSALDAQVSAKAAQKALEKDQNQYFDELALSHARQIELNRQLAAAQEKQRLSELAFYQQRQAVEKRERELSSQQLVNPLSEKSEIFLQFAGEDPNAKQRQKLQQQQQQQWIAQQLLIAQEKEESLKAEAEEFAHYQRTLAAIHTEQQKQRQAELKMQQKDLANYNFILQSEKAGRLRQAQIADEEAAVRELNSTLNSDFLNERTEAHRNANVHFKGFSVQERQEILNEQLRQQEEAKLIKEREQEEEKAFAEEQERVRLELLRIDRERAAAELQRKLALKAEQAVQHKEHVQREDHLKKVVYKNPVSEAYFSQFGTSHR